MLQTEPIEFSFETDIMYQLGELNLDSTLSNLDLYTQHLSTSPPVQHSSLGLKSVFYPHQSKCPHMTTFYNMMYADIKRLCSHPSPCPSDLGHLSPLENKAIKSLASNENIIIKTADKGGGIVVMDRDDYIKEAYRLLADTTTYRRLTKDPLPEYKCEVNLLIERATQSNILEKSSFIFN